MQAKLSSLEAQWQQCLRDTDSASKFVAECQCSFSMRILEARKEEEEAALLASVLAEAVAAYMTLAFGGAEEGEGSSSSSSSSSSGGGGEGAPSDLALFAAVEALCQSLEPEVGRAVDVRAEGQGGQGGGSGMEEVEEAEAGES